MASVNKVIIVGNLGRDPQPRFLPWSAWNAQTDRALEQLERLIASQEGAFEELKRLTSELEPFFARVARTRGELAAAEARRWFDNQQRLLALLGLLRSKRQPQVELRVAHMRKRATRVSSSQLGLGCRFHRRSASHHRACQARYALLRFEHFLPAAAATISLT